MHITRPRRPTESESRGARRPAAERSAGHIAQIDRASPVPYYYQLQEILKQEIDGGRWSPGDLLPSEAELASALRISRTVIRKALDVLEGDGQVRRVKGKGTIVAPPKFRYEAVSVARDWFQHATAISVTLAKVIHAAPVPVTGHLARLLDTAVDDGDAWEFVVVSALTTEPVSLSQVFIRRGASPRLASLTDPSGILTVGGPDIFEQLAEWDVAVAETKVDIEHAVANEFEAEELGIPLGGPLLLLSLRSIGPDHRPLGFTRTVVRSDRFHLSLSVPSRMSLQDHVLAPNTGIS